MQITFCKARRLVVSEIGLARDIPIFANVFAHDAAFGAPSTFEHPDLLENFVIAKKGPHVSEKMSPSTFLPDGQIDTSSGEIETLLTEKQSKRIAHQGRGSTGEVLHDF